MALPTATPASQRTPQVIGAAFVQQYYHVLHKRPEQVHRFYHDSSIISRPDPDGGMSEVTTLKDIDEKVLSFKFNSYIAEIETVDSLQSYNEGVFIVVTGCLTASDNVRRKFTQSFFLAPQDDNGYFVLNDIFRFVDLSQTGETNQILASNDNDDGPKASSTALSDSSLVKDNHSEDVTTEALEGDLANQKEAVNPSESCASGVEDEADVVSPIPQSKSSDQSNHKVASASVQDDGPKKSYASIVKVVGSTPPKKISAPAKPKAKAAPPSTEKSVNGSNVLATASDPKVSRSSSYSENNPLDVEGYSIHIRNLPSNATVELVEEELKKFGPIKPGGVQVRNHKVDNFCYGFVEFESLDSMQAAIKASPITISGCSSFIEEKRTSTRVVNGVVVSNGRGRFSQTRGGFRNDNFRGNTNFRGNNDNIRGKDDFRGNDNFRGINDNFRGNGNGNFQGRGGFGGNSQGYGRTEFKNRGGEFSGRGRGRGLPANNSRDGYHQRPVQNGNGNGRMVGPVAVTA